MKFTNTLKIHPLGAKTYKVLKFMGRRGFLWLLINFSSGAIYGIIEMAVAGLLATLLLRLDNKSDASIQFLGLPLSELSLSWILVCLVAVGLSRAISQFVTAHSARFCREVVTIRLQLLLLYDLFKRPKHLNTSIAETNFRISEVFPKSNTFIYYVACCMPAFLQAVVLFVIILSISVRDTIIGFSGLIVAGLLTRVVSVNIKRLSNLVPQIQFGQTSRLISAIKNLFLLRALRTTDQELSELNNGALRSSSTQVRAAFFANIVGVLPQFFGIVVIALLVGVQLEHPLLSSAGFVSFLYLYVRLVQSLGQLTINFGELTTNFPFFKIGVQYFSSFEPNELQDALQHGNDLQAFAGNWREFCAAANKQIAIGSKRIQMSPPPTIEFSNVSFRYPNAEKDALRPVSFKVNAGAMFSIVGPSGAGKSTLLAIAMDILQPTTGSVLFDGKAPKEFFKNERNRIGYVGADPFLLDGTLRENLLYGRNELFSDDEIWEALEMSQLAESLRQNSITLDHRVSDFGEGLSTGQKQRLSLARAFLSRPGILIFDEISANLDIQTEDEIAKVIHSLEGQSTILVVSHRENLIKDVKNRVQLK